MAKFRVALSGDFVKADGSPTFPMFDLAPLRSEPNVEVDYVAPVDGVMPATGLAGHDALILLTPKFDKSSVPADGRLAIVARFGVGYDSVDVESCTAAGIALAITPDGVRRPVAAAILTFILALAGKMMIKDKLTRGGPTEFAKKTQHMGVGLIGRTLGSVGIGNIGAEMFRLCKPLDMKFIAHDPFADRKVADSLGVRLVDLETVFRESDFVTVNCPLMPETTHLVNAARLALMKPTAYFINTARGPIVDQKALTKALQERRIAGAGLDVFDPEPPPPDDPILKLDNVILAPHALCWTDQCFAGIGASDVRAVLDVMHGRDPVGIVNRAVLSTPAWRKRLDGHRAAFGG
jgi:phosphoglycerate dehydrogenase-like enzyme